MSSAVKVIIAILLWAAPVQALENIEIYRADFHGHLAQKIYLQVKNASPEDKLIVTLTSDKGLNRVIFMKESSLKPEEVFVLDQRELPSANYTLSVQMLDKQGKALRESIEKFNKPYDGTPKVGIDENNNICVNGKPFFMVAPFFVGKEKEIQEWIKYINTLKGVGFIEKNYTLDGWKEFLNLAEKFDKMVVGPLQGYYWPHKTATARYKNSAGISQKDYTADIDKIAGYIKETRDHKALLMWAWKDEPELGGRRAISPAEVRRWTEKSHELDPHHLVFCNFGGYKFTHLGPKYRENNWHQQHMKKYCYMFYNPDLSAKESDGNKADIKKTQVADVYSMDYYPIEYEKKAAEKGYTVSIEDMCLAMDRMREWNYNLVPVMAYVETCDVKGRGTPAPAPEEVRLLIWANIVHGAKGISWFHYFNPTPPENFKEMERFLNQITRLTPAVLGPDYAGKAGVKGNADGRIDVMTKEHEGIIYVFAVNLKKKEDMAVFNVNGMLPGSDIEVFDEGRVIKGKGRTFEDRFDKLGVRIYKIKK